jgi:glycerophosphoryl diester phosphodiesterase
VLIQSFETANLRALRAKVPRGSNVRLLQLFGGKRETPYDTVAAGHARTYGDLMRPDGLRDVATYADAIGPAYRDLDPHDGRSALVDAAHAAGLEMIVYTFRPENQFLGPHAGEGGAAARNEAGSVRQIRDALALGIDAFFTDDPALGRRAVDGDR